MSSMERLREAAQRRKAEELAKEAEAEALALEGPQDDDYAPVAVAALMRPAQINPALEYAQHPPRTAKEPTVRQGDVLTQLNVRVKYRLLKQLKREAKINGISMQDMVDLILSFYFKLPLDQYPPESLARLPYKSQIKHPKKD